LEIGESKKDKIVEEAEMRESVGTFFPDLILWLNDVMYYFMAECMQREEIS
jgi:hypothetical protein